MTTKKTKKKAIKKSPLLLKMKKEREQRSIQLDAELDAIFKDLRAEKVKNYNRGILIGGLIIGTIFLCSLNFGVAIAFYAAGFLIRIK